MKWILKCNIYLSAGLLNEMDSEICNIYLSAGLLNEMDSEYGIFIFLQVY
jgi:hypothetical protein